MKDEFQKLVSNALDFLKVSAHELDEQGRSKYAVISFFSGLELILKARLLLEDWRLCVVEKNGRVAEEDFLAGNFQSIGLHEAKARLKNILNGQLAPSEIQIFEGLRRRRNQAVHFYHPEHLGSNEKIAVEQLIGWNLLYKRMMFAWKDHFEPFFEELTDINCRMSRRADYFPAVYHQFKKEIETESKTRLLAECESCLQLSTLSLREHFNSVYVMHCLVCEAEQMTIFFPCENPKCGKPAERSFGSSTPCRFCGRKHEIDFTESSCYFESLLTEYEPIVWCGMCGYTPKESVVSLESGSLCFACHAFIESRQINYCEWCDSQVTGPVGNRTSPGCVRCYFHLTYEEPGEKAPRFIYDRKTWLRHRQLTLEEIYWA